MHESEFSEPRCEFKLFKIMIFKYYFDYLLPLESCWDGIECGVYTRSTLLSSYSGEFGSELVGLRGGTGF